jgi:hypothetical protein
MAAILKSASSLMVAMFFWMNSTTGATFAGSAHPTQVTPDTGKARACAARFSVDVTESPSSLASEPHGTHEALRLPPNAAPARSGSLPMAEAPSSSSSSPVSV